MGVKEELRFYVSFFSTIDDVSDVRDHGDVEWASHIAGFRLIFIRGLNFRCNIDADLDTIFE